MGRLSLAVALASALTGAMTGAPVASARASAADPPAAAASPVSVPPAAEPATAEPATAGPATAGPAAAGPAVAGVDPSALLVGGVRLGMTPAEVMAALHGRDFDVQTIRRPTADGHDTFVAALLMRSRALKPRPTSSRLAASHTPPATPQKGLTAKPEASAPGIAAGEAMAVPAEQLAVVFSQFDGNRATEIVRLRRYDAGELVGDAKLRQALAATYGLDLPPLDRGGDAPDTLTATRAWPQHSADPPAVVAAMLAATSAARSAATSGAPGGTSAGAPPGSTPPGSATPGSTLVDGGTPAAAAGASVPTPAASSTKVSTPVGPDPAAAPGLVPAGVKLPSCTAISDHLGFDMALLASDPGMAAMPLWTGFIPGCGVTLSVSAHRAAQDPAAYDLILQHLIDQSAALADLTALGEAREQAATAAARARQEEAAGHAPSL